MRIDGGDVLSALAALSVPLAVALALPSGAIGFVGSRKALHPDAPRASIVFLDPSAAAGVMRATKILPRNDGGGRMFCADLLSLGAPDDDMAPVLSIGERRRPGAPSVVGCGIPPYLPSRRAAAPVRLPSEKDRDDLPFPRNELLKLN